MQRTESTVRPFGFLFLSFESKGSSEPVMVLRYFNRIGSLVLVLCVFAGGAYGQSTDQIPGAYPDVRLLESDSRGITLEFRPQALSTDTVRIDSRDYLRVNFLNGGTPDFSDPERAEQRYRAITFAMPAEREPAIEILGSDYRRVTHPPLLPMGEYVTEDEETYRTFRNVRNIHGYSDTLARMSDIGTVGGLTLGTVHLYPVQLLPDGSGVRIHSRIVVRLSFAGGSFSPVDGHLLRSLRHSVINIDQVPARPEVRLRTDALARTAPAESSVLAGGPWYTFEITERGMYRVTAQTLQDAGIPIGSIDPRTIKIYGNGGRMLPENLTASRPEDLTEIAIFISGEGDGTFNQNDYIVFFGESTVGWNYDPQTGSYTHRYNYYEANNRYFLTYGGPNGRRMASLPSLAESNPVRPDYFISRLVHREPKINLLGSGKRWMGESFTAGGVTVFTNMLHGFTPSVPIQYRIQVAARAPVITRFAVEDQGTSLGSIAIGSVSLGSETGLYANAPPVATFTRSGSLPENRSALRFEYQAGAQSDGFLEWFEIHYPRQFRATDDYLYFHGADTTGVVEYTVQGFTSAQIAAYDITDHAGVRRITDTTISGATIRFQVAQTRGEPSSFMAVANDGYKTVDAMIPVDNSDVRGIVQGAEFIILSPPEFLAEAERLKQHRETFPANQLSTVVVNVKSIFNEFSGGLTDPTAIRDFLYNAHQTWQTTPRYVLLFGAGSFDYRYILNQRQNFIPSYQTSESLSRINTYTTDDYFVQFSPGSGRPSMGVGRLNAVNADDARIMVDKIIHYETGSEYGPWRNLISYVADDGWTTQRDEGNLHTWQSERLAQQITPDSFEKDKIYIIEYPTEFVALGRRKPAANRAIVDRFNQGTVIMNWTGHGNPRVWAHEWVFVRETTIPQLNNRDRLTFITAATCDFSRLDDPREQSGGELLVSREQGGAIGVLSSSRIVWSDQNAVFNNIFYTNVLTPNDDGYIPRVGDGLFATKQTRFDINDVKFVLLGDPTIRLLVPSHRASVATVNGEPVTSTVNLKALQKVTIEGDVRTPDGETKDTFNGQMYVIVYDSDKDVRIDEWGGFTFRTAGNVLFRGQSSVTDGTYASSFIVPKDISHEGRNGRIALYFWEEGLDGRGFSRDIVVGGIDTTAVEDSEGPTIDIYLDNRQFRSGDLVSEQPQLLVDLFDESGINVSGGGVGHRIEAWLNEGESIDLTDYYTGTVDSYQEGSIVYRFTEELEPGPHHLRLRAWDVYNNSATEEVFFQVASGDNLSIRNVYNYPNPFRDATVFTFQHNQSMPIDVDIRIYTVAGRMIARLREYSVGDRFVRIPWSGRDDDGDRLANGVYLYTVTARTVDGMYSSEALGRMSVMR
jgi:hypothetical protein